MGKAGLCRPGLIDSRRVHERAAARAFENLTAFIEGMLKLKVNRAKSAVARPWERKLLGFSFTRKDAKRRIASKALAKAKDRIRELIPIARRFPADHVTLALLESTKWLCPIQMPARGKSCYLSASVSLFF